MDRFSVDVIMGTQQNFATLGNLSQNSSDPDLNRKLLIMQNDQRAITLLPAILYVALLMVIGVVGNSTVCYVFLFRLKTTTQNVLFVFLAVFDLLSCCVAMPTEIVDMRYYFLFESEVACKSLRFILAFSVFASIMTLVVIAVDRFRKVCRPLAMQMTPREARLWVLGGCGVAGLASVPAVVLYGKRTATTSIPGVVGSDCSTSDAYLNMIYPFLYEMFQAAGFFSVTTALIVIYVKIWLEIRRHRKYLMENSAASLALIQGVSDVKTSSSCPQSLQNSPAPARWARGLRHKGRDLDRPGHGKHGPKPVLQLQISLGNNTSQTDSRLTSMEDLPLESAESLQTCSPASSSRKPAVSAVDVTGTKARRNLPASARERSQSCENVSQRTAGSRTSDSAESPSSQSRDALRVDPSSGTERRHSDGDRVPVRDSGDTTEQGVEDSRVSPPSQILESFQDSNCRRGDDGLSPRNEDCNRVDVAGKVDTKGDGMTSDPSIPLGNRRSNVGRRDEDVTELSEGAAGEVQRDLNEDGSRKTGSRKTGEAAEEDSHRSLDVPSSQQTATEDCVCAGIVEHEDNHRVGGSTDASRPKNGVGPSGGAQSSRLDAALSSTNKTNRRESEEPRAMLGPERRVMSPTAQRTTVIAFLVTCIFICSFLPHLSLLVARSIDSSFDYELEGASLVAFNIFLRSYFVNNAANPIIYGFMNLQFRRECLRLAKCLCCPFRK